MADEKKKPEPKLAEGEVRLLNPAKQKVVVPASHVGKHRLFESGFRRIKGEKYPDEVNGVWRAYKEHQEARGFMVADADPGDTGQQSNHADDTRRAGSKAEEPAKGTRGTVVDEDKADNLNQSTERLNAALNPGAKPAEKVNSQPSDEDGNALKNGDAVDENPANADQVTDDGKAVEKEQPGDNPDATEQNTGEEKAKADDKKSGKKDDKKARG